MLWRGLPLRRTFVPQAGPYPRRGFVFFIWRTLHFQEGFYSSGVECSADKAAVSQLAAWSLQSEPHWWTAVPAAACPKGIPSTDQAAGSGGPLAWVALSTLRSSSFSRKTLIINLSKRLLIFLFWEEFYISGLQGWHAWKLSGTPGRRGWDTTKMLHLGKTEILKWLQLPVELLKQLPVDFVSSLTLQLCYIYGCNVSSSAVTHMSVHIGKYK